MDLREDWFGRSNEGFTYRSDNRLLDWEGYLDKSAPYSTFLGKFNPKGKELKKQTALSVLSNIKNIMLGVNSRKFSLKLTEEGSSTDLVKEVNVEGSPLFDNKLKSFNHALDVLIGSEVHELAHILYTNKSIKEVLSYFGAPYDNMLFARLVNIIEDERINKNIGDSFTGFSNYLAKNKLYYFKEKLDNPKLSGDFVTDLYNALLLLIRYPSILPDSFIEEYGEFLTNSKSILTPYPENMIQVLDCSKAIYDLVKDNLEEEAKKQQDQQKQEQKKGKGDSVGSGEGKGSDKDSEDKSEEGEDSGGSGKENSDEKEESGSGWDENDDSENEEGDGSEGESEEEAGDGLEEKIEEFLKKICELSEKDLNKEGQSVMMASVSPAKSKSDDDSETPLTNKLVINRFTENSELPLVIFEKMPQENKEAYVDALSKVGVHASTLSQKLNYLFRDDSFTDHGLKEGDLDEDNLADYVAGSSNIYQRESIVKSSGGAIVLLLDHSGSTSSYSLYTRFREVAILFCEALKAMPNFEFYAYSHGTRDENINGYRSDYTNVIPLVEKDFNTRYTIGSHKSRNEANRDGQALLFVADRVKQLTELPITILMVNDGEPAASNPPGFDDISYTKHCVNQVEAMGIDVIQVAVTSGIPSEKMFKKFVTFTDYGSLVKNCGDLLYKIINEKQGVQ